MLLNKKVKVRSQRGLSLIEAAMVLALSAVVVAGAVMYYGSASDNSKVQRAQSQIGAIQSAVASLYANQASYNGLTVEVLKNSGALPASYFATVGGNHRIVNPWTGQVTIAATNADATYELEYNNVPARACVKLLTSEPGTSVRAMKTDASASIAAKPLSLANAATVCGTATTTLGYTLA